MPQMFFGQYLLDQEVISADALHEALDLASRENARIGALAVERSLLSDAQVELVQLEQRRTDMGFADLAVELELLTREQADALLRDQRRRHKPIGEALVELGHLELDELDDWLERYHLSLLDLDAAHLELPFELVQDDLAPYLVEYLPKLFRRITQVPMKLQGARAWLGRSNLPYRATITIRGDCPVEIGIAACDELAAILAAGLGDRKPRSRSELEVQGAVLEFAEIFADAGCRSVRRDGLDAGVEPARGGELPKHGFWFPATTPCGRGILVLEPR